MAIKSSENSFGAWVFLVGLIIALVIGILSSTILPLTELKNYSAHIYGILVFLGLIVGFSIKVGGKESDTFLVAGAVIVVISRFGMESMTGSLIGIGIGDTVSSAFAALLALFVPATIIVAVKRVFSAANI